MMEELDIPTDNNTCEIGALKERCQFDMSSRTRWLLFAFAFIALPDAMLPVHAAPSTAPPSEAATSVLSVACDGENAGAEVMIDGKFKGECPIDVHVPSGRVKLRVEKKDASSERVFEQEIRLGDGVMKKVTVVLTGRSNSAEKKLEGEGNTEAGMKPGKIFKDCPECPEMVVLPAGSFNMGSSKNKNESPIHNIIIRQPFALSKTEITRSEFTAFVNATGYDAGDKCWTRAGRKWEESSGINWRNPGYKQDGSHPVACINLNDAQAYAEWLSRKTSKRYKLPSESQWEYACRAGGSHEYCGSNNNYDAGWYDDNSSEATHPVGKKQANAFGLYDMSGNVWEWTEDSYHDNYSGAPDDGSAWSGDGATRVIRGGSWVNSSGSMRSAIRNFPSSGMRSYGNGFRVSHESSMGNSIVKTAEAATAAPSASAANSAKSSDSTGSRSSSVDPRLIGTWRCTRDLTDGSSRHIGSFVGDVTFGEAKFEFNRKYIPRLGQQGIEQKIFCSSNNYETHHHNLGGLLVIRTMECTYNNQPVTMSGWRVSSEDYHFGGPKFLVDGVVSKLTLEGVGKIGDYFSKIDGQYKSADLTCKK